MKDRRILFFSADCGKGGSERTITYLCNGVLCEDGITAILTVLKGEWSFELKGNIKHFGIIEPSEYYKKGKLQTLPHVMRYYYSFVKKFRPDIIIAFLPEPCFIAAIYRRKLGVPVIGSERGNPYYQFRKPTYRILGNRLYSKLDGVVFQTAGAMEYFTQKVQKYSCIIGNPVEKNDLPIIPISQRRKEIVAVGRFAVEKNYPLLVRAFERVLSSHPDYVLKIYGLYREDDEAVSMIREKSLGDSIILEGPVDDVKERINDAYAYVLSSFTEGLPNALLEAMSVGLPVVATDCPSGGPRQLINDGVNGLLVENENEDSLVNALNRLIENPDFANKIGFEARKVTDIYSENIIGCQWLDYINSVKEWRTQIQ